tara:strand:+ start:66 stop:920 length:855 start_codon:yes stop_codon:yes gene_type:complete
MKRTSLTLSLLLLFAGGVWGEDENIIKDLNLEGRWIAAYLPISYEEIIDVSKQGNEYIVTKIRGDQYVPSGEVSMKADLNFQNCKGQGASKGFKNPYWIDCRFEVVSEDLIAGFGEGIYLVAYRDLPEATHSFCVTDWKEKLPENGLETILNMRPKAFKHCLACEGTNCKMKNWPEGREAESLICKKLFCKPTRAIGKSINSEDVLNVGSGASEVHFTYRISKKGTAESLVLTSFSGAMNKKQARTFTRNILASFQYEPIELDGEIYEIDNLRGWLYWNINDMD